MSYDHPAYTSRNTVGAHVTGSGGAFRFAAFTDMRVKAVVAKPTTAGTSNDTLTAYKLSGTTTTTQVLTTYGSGVATSTRVESSIELAQGDAFSIVKGTDATGVIALGVELELVPGANVTA